MKMTHTHTHTHTSLSLSLYDLCVSSQTDMATRNLCVWCCDCVECWRAAPFVRDSSQSGV